MFALAYMGRKWQAKPDESFYFFDYEFAGNKGKAIETYHFSAHVR